jgi:hypothetical protein
MGKFSAARINGQRAVTLNDDELYKYQYSTSTSTSTSTTTGITAPVPEVVLVARITGSLALKVQKTSY